MAKLDKTKLMFPPLTFYKDNGEINFDRINKLLARVFPYSQGVLVPGSTGDGWILGDEEQYQLVKHYLNGFEFGQFDLIIGALMPNAELTLVAIHKWCDLIKSVASCADLQQAMNKLKVVGFAICSPQGQFTQDYLEQELEKILKSGYPIAFYQLPQITGNIVNPQVLRKLADHYPNLIMIKDSGGGDEIACSLLFEDTILVRGAEGDPTPFISGTQKVYDGLLLSTVNSFPERYSAIIAQEEVYERIGSVIQRGFELASKAPISNPFSDTNRAIDHIMYHDYDALKVEMPLCIDGQRLDITLVKEIFKEMEKKQLIPEKGYGKI